MTKPSPKKPAKKEVANEKEVVELPRYNFILGKITLDGKTQICLMEIFIVQPPIRKVHKLYLLNFIFNPEPWLARIRSLETQIMSIRNQPSLLAEEDEKKIEGLESDMANEKEELKRFTIECSPITFSVSVNEVKYSDRTRIIFNIPRSYMNTINDKLAVFSNYKIELEIT